MNALPGSGLRPDQALATAQAFEKLIESGDRGAAYKNSGVPAVQPSR
jgi:hypothetical protein